MRGHLTNRQYLVEAENNYVRPPLYRETHINYISLERNSTSNVYQLALFGPAVYLYKLPPIELHLEAQIAICYITRELCF